MNLLRRLKSLVAARAPIRAYLVESSVVCTVMFNSHVQSSSEPYLIPFWIIIEMKLGGKLKNKLIITILKI